MPKPQASDTARPHSAQGALPSAPGRYSSDEAKARRIAARYGISW